MSDIGERDDAPELELEVDGEELGGDESGSDEGDADAVGEEPGEGDVDPEQDDAAGTDDGQAGKPAEVAAKPRSAATIAVQTAKRAAKEAAERAERAERALNEFQQQGQRAQTAEQQRLEAEKILLMPPEEKFDYLLNKERQERANEFGVLKFQMADSADRTAFESLCSRNPAFDAVRDEVETALTQMRNRGGNSDRTTVATYLIGKRAIERAQKGGKAKQAAKGRENVQRQTVKPAGGRSDVAGGRERSGGGSESAQRAARLADQQI